MKLMPVFRCCCKCVFIYSMCGVTHRGTQHSDCLVKKKRIWDSHVYCSKHTLEDNTVCLRTATSGHSFPLKMWLSMWGFIILSNNPHKRSISRNLRALCFKNTSYKNLPGTFPAVNTCSWLSCPHLYSLQSVEPV